MKNVQRINESQLRAIVAESVKKVLYENGYEYSKYIVIQDAILSKDKRYEEGNIYLYNTNGPIGHYYHFFDSDQWYADDMSDFQVVEGAHSKDEMVSIFETTVRDNYRYYFGMSQQHCPRCGGRGSLDEQEQPTFGDYFNRSKDYHIQSGRKYGFELRKDGEWKYGDIEYDPNEQTMSCMGISIKVQPNMTILDAEEDLFEELIKAGYDSDF